MILNLRRNITQKVLALLVLGAVSLLILNKALFLHTHQLSDGTFVLHAHPFQAGSDTSHQHQHSNCAYFLFDQISQLYAQNFDDLTLYHTDFYTRLFSKEISYILENYSVCLKNRAPPV
jgi:hypothetical protein